MRLISLANSSRRTWTGNRAREAVPDRRVSVTAPCNPAGSVDLGLVLGPPGSIALYGVGMTALGSQGTSCRSDLDHLRTRPFAQRRRSARGLHRGKLGAPGRSVKSRGEIDVVHHSVLFEFRLAAGHQHLAHGKVRRRERSRGGVGFVSCRYTPGSYNSNGTGSCLALTRPRLTSRHVACFSDSNQ